MRKLIKTMDGMDCEVFAICHHNRIQVGKAQPTVEVYEDSVEVPTVNSDRIQYKNTFFSIVICPDPEMEKGMAEETLGGLTAFDLKMWLPRKDDTYVPFMVYGVSDADLNVGKWVFRVKDPETLKKLLEL